MDKHPEFRRTIPLGPFGFNLLAEHVLAEHETGQKRH
jgi:hypothetical protein